MAIEFHQVVAGYSPTLTILNELSFVARDGEITLLIGPNGAGKSTALKTLFGLLVPRAGSIRLDGREIGGTAPREMLAQGVAFVPQGRNLFGSLSVLHNLELGGITLKSGLASASPKCSSAFRAFASGSITRPRRFPAASRSSSRSAARCSCARGSS